MLSQPEQERGLGFAGLSRFMSIDKEHAGFVFRRFGRLAARDLLCRQSELIELQARLERLDKEDASSSDARRRAAKNWQLLCEEALGWSGAHHGDNIASPPQVQVPQPTNDAAEERKALALEIRHALKEYQEAILRNAEVLKLQRVPEDIHESILAFFWATDKTHGIPMLTGVCEEVFGKDPHGFTNAENLARQKLERDDLLSLSSRNFEDILTRWLRRRPELQRLWRRRRSLSAQVVSLSDHRINVAVVIVNVLVVAGLLFGAIFNLYFVENEKKRLGILTAYTLTFSGAIALLTEARRVEIFGAAAAYAAVLVVFVSGGLGRE